VRALAWIALLPPMIAILGADVVRADEDVRKELDAQYEKLARAHDRRDLAAIVAMKTADFHAIFPDGKVGDAKTMEEYSRQFLEGNQPPYNIRVTIQTLTVSEHNLIAVADILQEVSRTRELAGKRRRVDTSVVQRETWTKTAEGWKLKCVDSVRDQKRFVDGKRVDPAKPYDPDAAPFAPDSTKRGP
jgi:hypothetical protein